MAIERIFDPLARIGLIQDPSKKADLILGKVPSEQLPSYVDDVINIEYFSDFQPNGRDGELWYDVVSEILFVFNAEELFEVELDYGRIYVNIDQYSGSYNSTFRFNGIGLILLGANVTRNFLENMLVTRTVVMTSNIINMSVGDDFERVCSENTQFTLINQIIKKPFRIKMTGGTLTAPLFLGYMVNWILTSLITDYVPAQSNYLHCEIRSAGQIYVFWGA